MHKIFNKTMNSYGYSHVLFLQWNTELCVLDVCELIHLRHKSYSGTWTKFNLILNHYYSLMMHDNMFGVTLKLGHYHLHKKQWHVFYKMDSSLIHYVDIYKACFLLVKMVQLSRMRGHEEIKRNMIRINWFSDASCSPYPSLDYTRFSWTHFSLLSHLSSVYFSNLPPHPIFLFPPNPPLNFITTFP